MVCPSASVRPIFDRPHPAGALGEGGWEAAASLFQ